MIQYSMKIDGAKEFERKLAGLETKVAKKLVRQAARGAQKILHQAARAAVLALPSGPYSTGKMRALISKAIVLRAKKKQKRGSYTMLVRLKGQSEGTPPEFFHTTKTGQRYFIPALIEHGHGANKESAARSYMRKAADETKQQVIRTFGKLLGQGIEQAMK